MMAVAACDLENGRPAVSYPYTLRLFRLGIEDGSVFFQIDVRDTNTS